uniref:Uncharacterized protein n=1 Tax=Oryza sativa subsp. japonica TaxID=39947 RepID=Q7XHR5_ORYSJ|nr:hypothetical protein [Oryza sativa Japonica Group]BAD62146.1 hypothetical protein [Oryza sativa Japonica Group]
MRRLEESYTTSPAVAHAGLWADVSEGARRRQAGPTGQRPGERERGWRRAGPRVSGTGERRGGGATWRPNRRPRSTQG